MNNISQDTLKRIVFALIGLIIGILDYLLPRANFQPDPLESIYKATAVTLLLFIAELALEIRDTQRLSSANYNLFVQRNRNITGALLAQIDNELDRAVKVQDDQFIVEHQTLAILSYDTFWKLLVEQISVRGPLTVQTIHSCAIDVWVDHPLTTSLLNRQREFCENGGQIIRIICYRGPKPTDQDLTAATQMTAAGIKVRYYNLSSQKILDHNFAWDFARVKETGEAAIWDSFVPGGVIGEAVYVNHSEYKGKNLQELWERVNSAASDTV